MDELNIPGPTHGPTEAQRAVRPIILTIDVEPDQRKTDARGGWEGSIRLLPQLEEHRSRLEKATGRPVQFNWFIRADPQIRIQFAGPTMWPPPGRIFSKQSTSTSPTPECTSICGDGTGIWACGLTIFAIRTGSPSVL